MAPPEEEAAPAAAVDLMAALRASVEKARAARGESEPTPIRAAKSAKKAAPAKKAAAEPKKAAAKKTAAKKAPAKKARKSA